VWNYVELIGGMAYLVSHARSPFWFLRFKDPETGRWKEENLKLRKDDPKESFKARREATKRSAEEAVAGPNQGEYFSAWVPDYTREHYRTEASQWRYLKVWQNLGAFLSEHGIRHPREIRYEHAFEYLNWRKAQGIAHNTARLEVKHLSFLLQEALRRDYLDKNPIALARIELAAAKEKKELTDDQIAKARRLFKKRAEKWMPTIFEILINTGCRFYEARLHKSRINFEARTILLEDSKRDPADPRKWFTAPMSDDLAKTLKSATWYDGHTMPEGKVETNRGFNSVLGQAARGATSHCCRVSFISRCHRAGLSEVQAMRLVNHSTRMVHRIYSRLGVEDAQSVRERVILPPLRKPKTSAPSAESSSFRKKGSRSA
jgi:hypothetical protein